MDKSAIVKKNHDAWRLWLKEEKNQPRGVKSPSAICPPKGWIDNTDGENPGKAPRKPLIKKKKKAAPPPPPPEPEPINEPPPEEPEGTEIAEIEVEKFKCPYCAKPPYILESFYIRHIEDKHPGEEIT